MKSDPDGLRYLYIKRDELTKNHQLDTNTAEGRMFEIKGERHLYQFISIFDRTLKWLIIFEPRHEKTGFLHMRKQRRRSASR